MSKPTWIGAEIETSAGRVVVCIGVNRDCENTISFIEKDKSDNWVHESRVVVGMKECSTVINEKNEIYERKNSKVGNKK